MSGKGDKTIDEIIALGEKHTEDMKPKKKKKKKMMSPKPSNPVGLAESQIQTKQNSTKSMFDEFMTGKSKIRR